MPRKQKLLTKEILKKIPPLEMARYRRPDQVKIPVKFFNPSGSGTWYVLEFDGEDTFYCYVVLHEKEFGPVSKKELESVRTQFGLPIERDAWWDSNTTLQEVLDGKKS